MNDIERAIRQFKHWEEDRWRLGKSPSIPTLILARQALEKQISKRPIGNDNGSYAEYFESWLECPKCGEAIPEYTAENNTWCYCLGCGQKLDWEKGNE